MEISKKKIIIDCDPGIDDALVIALALASPQLDILGITTVAGNRELEKTTANALKVLEYFGRKKDIPVYTGAAKPLVKDLYMPGDSVHGRDGLGDCAFPDPQEKAKGDAVEFIAKMLAENPGEVTILAIGPLTNIAMLLKKSGGSLIKELCLMNGAFSVPGNATEYAEYNAFIDPDAAEIVYSSGVPIKIVGLDVTDPVAITREEFEQIKEIDTDQARLFVMTHQWAIQRKQKDSYAFFWDPIALAWLLDEQLIKSKNGRVEVDTQGETAGRTRFIEGSGNAQVGTSIDSERFFKHLYNFLKWGRKS